MQEIQFSGQLTETDYRSISALSARKLWIVAGGVLLVLVLFDLWNGGLRESLSDLKVAILTLLPVAVIIPVVFLSIRYSVRRHWRSNKVMQQPFKGTISEEGINWEVEGLLSSHVPWDLCLKYRESSNMILVYQGINQVFYFFPRYFANEAQWKEFRGLVARKLTRK